MAERRVHAWQAQRSSTGGERAMVERLEQTRLAAVDDEGFERHEGPAGHPERVERFAAARRGLTTSAFAATAQHLPPAGATLEQLSRAHASDYVEQVLETSGRSGYFDADTFFCPYSAEVARQASGGAVSLTDALIDGDADFGLGVWRPPGHHARPAQAMGFCLFNHVAVAARHALSRGVGRVLILDWDVHHGNGTEEIFEDDPRVLYVSLHQSPQYPGTGAPDDIGRGEGAGFNVNVPLGPGADNAVYRAAFERLLVPIIEQFAPELSFVSAGYDAHYKDPLGGMNLDEAGYAYMTHALLGVLGEQCRTSFLLEGGYDLSALTGSVKATLDALVTAPAALSPLPALSARHETDLQRAITAQKPYWRLS
jgi:acetoin utilization deacetylase AcuC-like enzyme